MSDQGVFVFGEDGVQFFVTVAKAAANVEVADVKDGVYEAFVGLDGERLLPRPVDETSVRLERSGDHDEAHLIELLERERATRNTFTSDPTDPLQVANELLAGEWETRWPKWPTWLDQRLHGTGPTRVEPIGTRTDMPQVGGAGSGDSPMTEEEDPRVEGRHAAQLYGQFESAFSSGADDEQRQVLLMRAIAGAIWSDGRVPDQVAATMRAVTSAWTSDHVPARDFLLEAKMAIWAELEAKNGDSTTIADVVDRTLRACLCLTELIDPAEAMDHAGWAAEMLSSEPWPRPPGSAAPRFF